MLIRKKICSTTLKVKEIHRSEVEVEVGMTIFKILLGLLISGGNLRANSGAIHVAIVLRLGSGLGLRQATKLG